MCTIISCKKQNYNSMLLINVLLALELNSPHGNKPAQCSRASSASMSDQNVTQLVTNILYFHFIYFFIKPKCNFIYLLVVTNSLLIVPRKFCLLGKMSELSRTQFDIGHRVVVVFGKNLAKRRERRCALKVWQWTERCAFVGLRITSLRAVCISSTRYT